MGALRDKALIGFVWSFVEKASVRGVSFIIGLLLARLLSPSDYGLIGMLAILMSVSQIFIESGFSKALVQKQDRNEVDFSTVFYFNIGVAILFYFVLFCFAPIVADFYAEPSLCTILRVLAINVILGSFNIVQRARLLIKIDFKTLAQVNFISTLISGLIGVFLAYCNYGVWALVYQTLLCTCLISVLLSAFTRWCPQWVFSFRSLKSMFSFGVNLLFAGIYAVVLDNIYTIAIGKRFHASELGYYTRSTQITDVAVGTIGEILNAVTYPLFASIQSDRKRLATVYSKMLSMTAFIVFPVMTLLAVLAFPLVRLVLTDKWLSAVPLIQWLCFARILTPISVLNMNILNAIGRSDLYLKVDLMKLPVIVLTMIFTIPLGVKAVVVGNLVSTIICYFINTYYPGKLFGYGGFKQLKGYIKIILSTGCMVMVLIPVLNICTSCLEQLIVGVLLGPLIYIVVAYLGKVEDLSEIIKVIKR